MKRIVPALVLASTLLPVSSLCKGEGPGVRAWARDFAMQPAGKRPKIEARYEDATRRAFVIEGETYRLTFDLQSEKGQRIRSLVVKTPKGDVECLTGDGGRVSVGFPPPIQEYTSAKTSAPSRVNVYRRGPYYIQVHWLDVLLSNSAGKMLPIRGDNAFIVRRWRTRIGGKQGVVPPGVAVQGEPNKETTLMLVPYAPGPATLQPGDFFECDLILLPYGPIGTEIPFAKPKAEAVPYGANAPRVVSVTRGTKRADFPTRVDADAHGVAEFTVEGGKGTICLIVGNLPTFARPRLYRKDKSRWIPVAHAFKGEDGYQTFVDANGRFGAIFLTDMKAGKPQTFRALNAPLSRPARGVRGEGR
jgi:hypothetical protein